ncbi:hypothetical protein [Azospirillum agricola]|uniref:hypothetical protein n=1 Tax=Azospirillum agricola TaxID=1720247 RepID=UPI000A0F08EA|nr:hypothetical protein [Azospirillum agricola]SMH43751.1 hypothetical protein SAMN02982994_1975 [Azospirillum lipoferum]
MDRRTTPTLSELLEDPIVVAVMARDGISRETFQQMLERVRRNLRAQQERIAA